MPPVLVREFENWKVLKASEADTKCYYFNTKTKEVTWLVPPGLNEAPRSGNDSSHSNSGTTAGYRPSISSTSNGQGLFGTALPIDNQMIFDNKSDEEPEYEISHSESDRPRQLSIHGPNTINSPQMLPPHSPPPPVAQEEQPPMVVPERVAHMTPSRPGWKPLVGQPCGALWIDGHFWKATVVAEDGGGLRYKVMYDVDGSEALVAREALRPPKVEKEGKPTPVAAPITPSQSTPSIVSRQSQSPIADLPRSSSAISPWASRDASNARSEMMARQNMLVQQFNTEFPTLRLPSLEDFYRPQYAAALQRFGQQDFELLCDAQKTKGAIGFFKQKGFLK